MTLKKLKFHISQERLLNLRRRLWAAYAILNIANGNIKKVVSGTNIRGLQVIGWPVIGATFVWLNNTSDSVKQPIFQRYLERVWPRLGMTWHTHSRLNWETFRNTRVFNQYDWNQLRKASYNGEHEIILNFDSAVEIEKRQQYVGIIRRKSLPYHRKLKKHYCDYFARHTAKCNSFFIAGRNHSKFFNYDSQNLFKYYSRDARMIKVARYLRYSEWHDYFTTIDQIPTGLNRVFKNPLREYLNPFNQYTLDEKRWFDQIKLHKLEGDLTLRRKVKKSGWQLKNGLNSTKWDKIHYSVYGLQQSKLLSGFDFKPSLITKLRFLKTLAKHQRLYKPFLLSKDGYPYYFKKVIAVKAFHMKNRDQQYTTPLERQLNTTVTSLRECFKPYVKNRYNQYHFAIQPERYTDMLQFMLDTKQLNGRAFWPNCLSNYERQQYYRFEHMIIKRLSRSITNQEFKELMLKIGDDKSVLDHGELWYRALETDIRLLSGSKLPTVDFLNWVRTQRIKGRGQSKLGLSLKQLKKHDYIWHETNKNINNFYATFRERHQLKRKKNEDELQLRSIKYDLNVMRMRKDLVQGIRDLNEKKGISIPKKFQNQDLSFAGLARRMAVESWVTPNIDLIIKLSTMNRPTLRHAINYDPKRLSQPDVFSFNRMELYEIMTGKCNLGLPDWQLFNANIYNEHPHLLCNFDGLLYRVMSNRLVEASKRLPCLKFDLSRKQNKLNLSLFKSKLQNLFELQPLDDFPLCKPYMLATENQPFQGSLNAKRSRWLKHRTILVKRRFAGYLYPDTKTEQLMAHLDPIKLNSWAESNTVDVILQGHKRVLRPRFKQFANVKHKNIEQRLMALNRFVFFKAYPRPNQIEFHGVAVPDRMLQFEQPSISELRNKKLLKKKVKLTYAQMLKSKYELNKTNQVHKSGLTKQDDPNTDATLSISDTKVPLHTSWCVGNKIWQQNNIPYFSLERYFFKDLNQPLIDCIGDFEKTTLIQDDTESGLKAGGTDRLQARSYMNNLQIAINYPMRHKPPQRIIKNYTRKRWLDSSKTSGTSVSQRFVDGFFYTRLAQERVPSLMQNLTEKIREDHAEQSAIIGRFSVILCQTELSRNLAIAVSITLYLYLYRMARHTDVAVLILEELLRDFRIQHVINAVHNSFKPVKMYSGITFKDFIGGKEVFNQLNATIFHLTKNKSSGPFNASRFGLFKTKNIVLLFNKHYVALPEVSLHTIEKHYRATVQTLDELTGSKKSDLGPTFADAKLLLPFCVRKSFVLEGQSSSYKGQNEGGRREQTQNKKRTTQSKHLDLKKHTNGQHSNDSVKNENTEDDTYAVGSNQVTKAKSIQHNPFWLPYLNRFSLLGKQTLNTAYKISKQTMQTAYKIEQTLQPNFDLAQSIEIPRGLLFVGPPGTGKTLLVKAMAGEAQVPVILESASKYIPLGQANEEFFKQGKARAAISLKNVFHLATKYNPCILFMDEIDTIGQRRPHVLKKATTLGSKLSKKTFDLLYRYAETKKHQSPDAPAGKHDEPSYNLEKFSQRPKPKRPELLFMNKADFYANQWSTVNPNVLPRHLQSSEYADYLTQEASLPPKPRPSITLLTELLCQIDAAKANSDIIIIGATNRPNVLDPALIRPGRLDKVIYLDLPNKQKRFELLKFYCNWEHEKNIQWDYFACQTNGLSSAHLSAAMNLSALRTIYNDIYRRQTINWQNKARERFKARFGLPSDTSLKLQHTVFKFRQFILSPKATLNNSLHQVTNNIKQLLFLNGKHKKPLGFYQKPIHNFDTILFGIDTIKSNTAYRNNTTAISKKITTSYGFKKTFSKFVNMHCLVFGPRVFLNYALLPIYHDALAMTVDSNWLLPVTNNTPVNLFGFNNNSSTFLRHLFQKAPERTVDKVISKNKLIKQNYQKGIELLYKKHRKKLRTLYLLHNTEHINELQTLSKNKPNTNATHSTESTDSTHETNATDSTNPMQTDVTLNKKNKSSDLPITNFENFNNFVNRFIHLHMFGSQLLLQSSCSIKNPLMLSLNTFRFYADFFDTKSNSNISLSIRRFIKSVAFAMVHSIGNQKPNKYRMDERLFEHHRNIIKYQLLFSNNLLHKHPTCFDMAKQVFGEPYSLNRASYYLAGKALIMGQLRIPINSPVLSLWSTLQPGYQTAQPAKYLKNLSKTMFTKRQYESLLLGLMAGKTSEFIMLNNYNSQDYSNVGIEELEQFGWVAREMIEQHLFYKPFVIETFKQFNMRPLIETRQDLDLRTKYSDQPYVDKIAMSHIQNNDLATYPSMFNRVTSDQRTEMLEKTVSVADASEYWWDCSAINHMYPNTTLAKWTSFVNKHYNLALPDMLLYYWPQDPYFVVLIQGLVVNYPEFFKDAQKELQKPKNNQSTEQVSEQSTEQGSEQSTEQVSEQSTEQVSEQSTEQVSEQSTEQVSEQSTEQVSDAKNQQTDSVNTYNQVHGQNQTSELFYKSVQNIPNFGVHKSMGQVHVKSKKKIESASSNLVHTNFMKGMLNYSQGNWKSTQLNQFDYILLKLVSNSFNKCFDILEQNRDVVDLLAYHILCRERLHDFEAEQIIDCFFSKYTENPKVTEIHKQQKKNKKPIQDLTDYDKLVAELFDVDDQTDKQQKQQQFETQQKQNSDKSNQKQSDYDEFMAQLFSLDESISEDISTQKPTKDDQQN